MKVVIAGGTGLIGRALGRRLVGRGDDVVVLSRARRVGPVRTVRWAPPQLGGWIDELRDADAVVNLAGASVGGWWWTVRRRRLLRDSRLVPTATLVEALRRLAPADRPGILLNASGTDVYEGRDETPACETTPPADSFLARLVRDWESEAESASPLGVRVVALRTSLVVAPEAQALKFLALPVRLFAGGRIGSGAQWVSWIDVEDAVGIALLALDDPSVRGAINLAAPDVRRQEEFAKAIGRVLGRPALVPIPGPLVRLALGDASILGLGSRRVEPCLAIERGYPFASPHLDDALMRALGKGLRP